MSCDLCGIPIDNTTPWAAWLESSEHRFHPDCWAGWVDADIYPGPVHPAVAFPGLND